MSDALRTIEFFVPDIGESLNAIMFREKGWAIYRGVKSRMSKAMLVCRINQIDPFRHPVRLALFPQLGPKRRKFDATNFVIALKTIEDILVECHVLRGDSAEYVHGVSIERPVRAPNGVEGILVRIAECDAAEVPEQSALELPEAAPF